MKKISFKKTIVLMFVMLSAILLVACGEPEGTVSDNGDSNEKIVIRTLTRMSPGNAHGDIFYEILDQFQEDYPEVELIDESTGDESSFNNKLATDISSGTLANIFRIQGVANLGEYIDAGLLMDLEPEIEEDTDWGEPFNDGFLDYYRVPGHEGIYAIPMETGLMGVYYNQALFEEFNLEYPETWTELLAVVDGFVENNIIPISIGAKSTYMAGHVHNSIFYKWLGTDAAKQLGAREKDWTDEDVVETIDFVKELNDRGAFGEGAAGKDENVALSEFLGGQAAMMITGPFRHATFSDPEQTEYTDSIRLGKFPYFEEKTEFKDEDFQLTTPYMVNGQLEGRERELTLELLKRLTDTEAATRFAEEAEIIIPRSDVTIDESQVSDLFNMSIELGATSTGISQDVFDYDPLTSMQDVTRNAIVSVFTGSTAEEAAQQIQTEIERNE